VYLIDHYPSLVLDRYVGYAALFCEHQRDHLARAVFERMTTMALLCLGA
jgi:hypothetical protein